MKAKHFFQHLAVAVFLSFLCLVAQAGIPKFSVVAVLPPPTLLPISAVTTAQYLITNNTTLTRTLTMAPIGGVKQTAGGCSTPFTLAPGQSCLLNLQITANQVNGRIYGGPVICKTFSSENNNPDPFLCSQAGPADRFNLTVIAEATISVTPTTEQVLEVGSTNSLVFTVTNSASSTVSAKAITATAPSTWTGTTITPSTGCSNLAIGSSDCTITLTTSTPNLVGQLTIQGSNTNSVQTPYIAFSVSDYLVFSVDTSNKTAKVIYPNDNSTGIVWDSSSGCNSTNSNCISVADTDYYDGELNSNKITIALSFSGPQVDLSTYAAGICFGITSDNSGTVGEGTWYLPALCELGPTSNFSTNCTSGTDNIYKNLTQYGFGGMSNFDAYWSSSQLNQNQAWIETTLGGTSYDYKYGNANYVRCVRSITY